jgi:signal transduction histidine kinase
MTRVPTVESAEASRMAAEQPPRAAKRRGRHRGWSLRQWAIASIALSVVVAVAAIVCGAVAIVRLNDARDRVTNRLDPAIANALNLSNALVDEETGVRGFALSAQESFLQPYTLGRQLEETSAEGIRVSLGDRFPEALADLDDVVVAATRWRTQFAEPTIGIVRTSGTGLPAKSIDAGKRLFDNVRSAVAVQQAHLTMLQNEARKELNRSATFLLWTAVAIGIALVCGATGLSVGLVRGVIRPLTGFTGHVRTVADGAFDHPITAAGPEEIRELGADVDSMRKRIRTELRALQEAHAALDAQTADLQRSNAELEQFAYVASHDLQEPLRKVASFCELLETRYNDKLDDRGRQYIHFAVDGAVRMQALINDLLAFSRVGRMGGDATELDANELLDAALANLQNSIDDTGATIESEMLPTVRGDRALLTAVLQNLISNSIKFRDPDVAPHIEITVRPQDDEWLFAVSDNGIGIEPEYADRIFVLFQRLHGRAAYPGTGIGLAMCRKIIEYHGGRIWLDTDSPPDQRRGSRFYFTLPRLPETEGATRP